jgi:acetyl-CoA C-acetyltransferase
MRVAIIAAQRSAIGSFGGAFAQLTAVELGSQLLRKMLEKIPGLVSEIDEVIIGQVLTAGCGQNPARQTALRAGLSQQVPATTVNKVCGSGLKAVQLGMQAIANGDAELVVAGGQEVMSQAAHVLPQSRKGIKMGNWQLVDSMLSDGLTDALGGYHMGITAENIAQQWQISREQQDQYALVSQQKAARAQQQGAFSAEIIPLEVPLSKGKSQLIETDEQIRPDSSLEKLSTLRPVFKTEGTVTAGNASSINDGAAFVILASEQKAKQLGLPILGYVVATASAGVAPELMGSGPIAACHKVLAKANWQMADVDLIEANEAFAAQALCVSQDLQLEPAKVNIHGGAIALGHPIGASGCRILVTLLHAMHQQQADKGLATLCIGGGMGIAMLVSRT